MVQRPHENTTAQRMWDATKAACRGKLIAQNAYIGKEERPQVRYLSVFLKKLENEEQMKPK